MIEIIIQKEKINFVSILDKCSSVSDGALLTFIGRVRDKSRDKEVTYIEYDIYEEMAGKELEKIANESLREWPITDCIIVHRYGRVDLGEAAIMIAVSSPHRDESFQALRYIIDTIKKRVPIWKKEHFKDGSMWQSESG